MVKISAGIGGTSAGAAPQGEWRQPQFQPEGGIDWTQPQYATPQPAGKQKHGKWQARIMLDVPQLPERHIRVRSRPPATYYTLDGMPIPAEWVTVPISPSIMQAIKAGDLERGPDPVDETAPPQQPPMRRRHHVEATS